MLALFFCLQVNAQRIISGKVNDANGEPLIGASIIVKGTRAGAITDINGQYTLSVPADATTLQISFVGYTTRDIAIGNASTLDATMEEGTSFSSVVVIGSRSTAARTKTETAVPIDVLTSKELQSTGQTEPTQMLHYVVPSFNSGRQTVADGTDHIDPSTLRGLGPDQVLTLLNGKRRHNQALMNINGTIGRGSVGTDMNAIPAAAIDRLEVMRDGASSQYGSDAIAGVINVVMKDAPGTSVTGHVGTYNTQYEYKFGSTDKRKMNDGEMLQLSVYHGMAVGKGKLGIALEYRDRQASNRTGDFRGTVYNGTKAVDDSIIAARGGFDRTFNMQVGNASSRNLLGFLNFNMPVGERSEFYLTAGGASRKGAGKGFYRYPKQITQVIPELYPNGFLPEIHSTIGDFSALVGIKGTTASEWRWDFSNVFGTNRFGYDVKNSNNASQFALKASAPTEFYAGTMQFSQNTTNFDVAKTLKTTAVKSLNLGLGAEFRFDNFKIEAGEEASWKNYDLTAKPLRVGGSQVFPGFQPSNEINKGRSVLGAYVDLESDITDKFLVDVAARVENYSDFGTNAAAKLAARYKFADEFVVRGAISNGFRAPSVHQRYFSNTSTQFVVNAATGQTVPNNVGTYRNDSEIAQALGIPSLKAETSVSKSLGVTSKLASIVSITVDAYQIDIKDRIVITGNMSRTNALINSLLTAGGAAADVTQVAFATNAINTITKGIDIVLGASPKLGKGVFDATIAANFTENKIDGATKTTDKLPADQFGKTFFGRLEESRIVVGQPRSKIAVSLGYRISGVNVNLRATQFGEVAVWDNTNTALDETFTPKTITDLTVSYKYKIGTLTLGANNLLDVYPDKIKNVGNTSDGRFIYSRNVSQFGFGGRYIYAAMRVDLK
ncbi:MAG: TonB-dependent receptor [Saprospiraceae bacterium]|nr:TonB-dependent receptor [Saprospiraceae bacterium]